MSDGSVSFKSLNGVVQGLLIMLSILAIVVPTVMIVVNFDARLDTAEKVTTAHITKDDGKWEKLDNDLDTIKDDVHALEMTDKELIIHYAEIIRRFDDLGKVVDSSNQRIMDRLDTFEAQAQGK